MLQTLCSSGSRPQSGLWLGRNLFNAPSVDEMRGGHLKIGIDNALSSAGTVRIFDALRCRATGPWYDSCSDPEATELRTVLRSPFAREVRH